MLRRIAAMHPHCRRPLLFAFATLVFVALSAASTPAPLSLPSVRIEAGEIDGANFAVALPDPWNRNVLLHAHGLRPDDAPMVADLRLDDAAHQRLLAEGWMIATTSYRRNGIVVRDAMADIDAVRERVETLFGAPGLVLLVGESMGGAIVTLLAERPPGRYHGALAIGAALHVRDAENPLEPTAAPSIPLLFLANQSEYEGPAAYVAAAHAAPVPPAIWKVARDGHVNVNHLERTQAMEALIGWITTDRIERERDGTVVIEGPDDAAGAVFDGDAVHGAVASVSDPYGNLFTTFRPADFAALGLKKGDTFVLEAGGQTFSVRYGDDFGDVARGEWIAFDRAEGVVLIARNFGNAAQTAGTAAGDALAVRRADVDTERD
jgi:pimeloyl-ACP methyl ester carboxylesterase